MSRHGWLVGVLATFAALAPGRTSGVGADGLGSIRQFLPAGAKVFFQVQANIDDTPAKEWVIAYQLVPPSEYVTYPAGYNHLLILRQHRAEWRKAFGEDKFDAIAGHPKRQFDELELRDPEGDRVLEIIVWCSDEGIWGFVRLDFRDGQFRFLPGLDFCWPESRGAGFIDLEGDGPLELTARGELPGYLAAMAPEEGARRPSAQNGPGHLDVQFYRFTDAGPVLYFPHPSVVVHGLNAGLVSGYRDTRAAAADASGILGVEGTVPRLLYLLDHGDEDVAHVAVEALARIGNAPALAGVLRAVEDKRFWVALAAAKALCDLDDPRAVEALLTVRNHPQDEVREAVAPKLGQTQHSQALPTLLQYLRDGSIPVRGAAVAALKHHEGPEVKERVAQLLDDPVNDVRIAAAKLLAERGDERGTQALKALEEELGEDLGERTEPTEHPGSAATLPLVDLGAPDSLDPLLELSRSGDHEAKRRLVEIAGERVEEGLARSLKDDGPPPHASIWGDLYYVDYETGNVPGWFLATSKRLGGKAIPILMSRVAKTLLSHIESHGTISEADYAAAVAAAHCLRELGAVEAIPLLLEMVAFHPDTDGREVAMWSLVSLRRQAAGITGALFESAEP